MQSNFIFTDEDEPLFMSLIEDLFPNMVQEKSYNNQLSNAISEILTDMGLVNHQPWALKLIQVSVLKIFASFLKLFRVCLYCSTYCQPSRNTTEIGATQVA